MYASMWTSFFFILFHSLALCARVHVLICLTERRLNDLMFYQLVGLIHCYCLCIFYHLFTLSLSLSSFAGIHIPFFNFFIFYMDDKIGIGWLKTQKELGKENKRKSKKSLAPRRIFKFWFSTSFVFCLVSSLSF